MHLSDVGIYHFDFGLCYRKCLEPSKSLFIFLFLKNGSEFSRNE